MPKQRRPVSDFSPLEQAAWGGLLGMHGRLFRLIEQQLLDQFRISHAEFEVLLRLSWADGHRMRIQDLAAQSLLTRSGISRVVERLARIDLVSREGAPEDGRGAYAVLTGRGVGTIGAALTTHVALVRAEFLDRFVESELHVMAGFWRRVEDHDSEP